MALNRIRVIELVGQAPGPFCGQVLADFGAEVIRVDRPTGRQLALLKRGKKLVLIDLKKDEGKLIFHKLCDSADVLIEPFRPGVMENLGLGPEVLRKSNPRLIYSRLTGYGQTGHYSQKAGHDINYLSITGVLSKLGPVNRPNPPMNILGDFAGGGLVCAMGICMALIEKSKSGKGQIIDSNLAEGTAYICSWIWETHKNDFELKHLIWPKPESRMSNLFDDGSPFYRCYKTKDNKFMAVGTVEQHFYQRFLDVLNLKPEDYNRYDIDDWSRLHQTFESKFLEKTQEEWTQIFDGVDACVTPVLDIESAKTFQHNRDRNNFFANGMPKPSPILSRTPAIISEFGENNELHTKQILIELGFSQKEIRKFAENKIIVIENVCCKL